jgi:hypothetical protein
MPPRPRHARASALTRIGSAAGWAARWLLVLVLAVDLIGSPLHGHVHDSGIDSHAWSVHVDATGWEPAHAEEPDTLVQLRHATLTVRAAAEDTDLSPEVSPVTTLVTWWPSFSLPADVSPVEERGPWRAAQPPPDYPDHRSLPPAGRAPPLRA